MAPTVAEESHSAAASLTGRRTSARCQADSVSAALKSHVRARRTAPCDQRRVVFGGAWLSVDFAKPENPRGQTGSGGERAQGSRGEAAPSAGRLCRAGLSAPARVCEPRPNSRAATYTLSDAGHSSLRGRVLSSLLPPSDMNSARRIQTIASPFFGFLLCRDLRAVGGGLCGAGMRGAGGEAAEGSEQ